MAQWKPPNCLFFFSTSQFGFWPSNGCICNLSFPQPWKKSWSHYWFPCKCGSKVKTPSYLKIKSDWMDVILSNCQLAQIPEKYLWTEFIYEARELFNHLFLNLYFLFRGDTLRSYISEGICSIDLKFTGS